LPRYAADNNDHNNQHLDQHDKHCATDNDNHDYGHWHYNHHDLEQHLIDHDDDDNRAALHRLMHMALVRRITKMDQGLWR
jgi:hypothetical protein